MTDRRGLFIAVEGIDGAGKTTQVDALAAALASGGEEVVVARPDGTALGRELTGLLLHRREPVEAWTEALGFTAARVQLVRETIEPALARGAVVVADRYIDSTLAYQGAGRGLDSDLLLRLHRDACQDLWPDLTILLELDPEQASRRRAGDGASPDRIEEAPAAFHRRVAAGFAALAEQRPSSHLRLDARRSPSELSQSITRAIGERFPSRYRTGRLGM